jgi:hypothetical protein
MSVKHVYAFRIMRPPTFSEWAIRASIAAGILLAVFVLIGAWRARKAHSPHASLDPNSGDV